MPQQFDRRQIMDQTREILRDAQVSPKGFFALFLALDALMRLANYFANLSGGGNELLPFSSPIGLFVTILVNLLSLVLTAGCRLYTLAIRRGERAEYLTLFDGFSFVGRVILLHLAEYLFIFLWSLPASMFSSSMLLFYGDGMLMSSFLLPLLLVPPLTAMYRYRFAIFNLCENPELGVMESIELSKRQTIGCKVHLVLLDLRFAGWILLSYLPTIAIVVINSMSLNGYVMPAVNEGLSLTAQLLFPLLVGVLYMPRYYTAEAGYYETAVANTGLDPLKRRHDQGPDNLGGYF